MASLDIIQGYSQSSLQQTVSVVLTILVAAYERILTHSARTYFPGMLSSATELQCSEFLGRFAT